MYIHVINDIIILILIFDKVGCKTELIDPDIWIYPAIVLLYNDTLAYLTFLLGNDKLGEGK